jgi:hypothetical protein
MSEIIGRCILSSSLFLCSAMSLCTRHLLPVIFMAGKNYGDPYEAFRDYYNGFGGWTLGVASWLFFIAALWIIRPLIWPSMAQDVKQSLKD